MSDLVTGLKALAVARPDHDEAEAMYEGTADEVIASAALRRALGDTGGKFRLNYARGIVGARMDKLELSSITTDDPEAQKLIDSWWADGEMADETHDVTEAACEFGECVVIVWPADEDDDGNVTDVDIYFNDPRVARVMYDPENPREVAFVVKVWNEPNPDQPGEKLTRVNLYYPDRLERYVSKGKLPQSGEISDSDFDEYVDDAGTMLDEDGDEYDFPGTWPIPAPLPGKMNAFHFRTGRPHGRPVHKDAYGPQNAINKLIATQMGNVDFTGLPQRYVLEDSAQNGGVGEVSADFDDDDIAIDDQRPRDTDDSAEGLKAEAGSVLWLKNAKATGTYEAANPDVFLNPWDKFVQGMSVTTKTPMSAFRIGTELPSGAARRADDEPLNGHVRDLQRRLGATWQSVYSYALELMLGREVEVTLSWAPLETFDDEDTWKVAAAQVAAGVPLRRVLVERGYTDTQCDDWGVPDYDDKTIAQKASDLASLAAAMRDLGTAQQLGVIDAPAVQAVIEAAIAPMRRDSGDA